MCASVHRPGFALVTTIVLMAAVAIVLGGVFSYVSHAARATAIAIGRDSCRLAAQGEIEVAKSVINTAFVRSIERSARIVGGDTLGSTKISSFDWF